MKNDVAKSSILAALSLSLVACIGTKTVSSGGGTAPVNKMVTGVVQSVTPESAKSAHVTTRASGTTTTDPTPGTTATGPQIVVNNMTFTLPAGTPLTLDGSTASDVMATVNRGMVVTLDAEVSGSAGVVNALRFRDELEGVVTAAYGGTLASGTMEVMGQTLTVNGTTVVEREDNSAVNIAAIPVNAVVEVSGFNDGNGNITATRIELKSDVYVDGQELELKGVIAAADAAQNVVTLGGLHVDVSNAVIDPQLAGTPDQWVGTYVQVKSVVAPDLATSPVTLIASEIEMEGNGHFSVQSQYGYEYDDEIKMEGLVAVDTANRTITINGQPVMLDPGVIAYIDWALLAANYDGQRTAIEGYLDANGNFVMTDIGYDSHTQDGFNDAQEDRDDDDDNDDDDDDDD